MSTWEIAVLPFDLSSASAGFTGIDRDLQFELADRLTGAENVPAQPADGPIRSDRNVLYLDGEISRRGENILAVQLSTTPRGDPVWDREYALVSTTVGAQTDLIDRLTRDIARVARRLQRELP